MIYRLWTMFPWLGEKDTYPWKRLKKHWLHNVAHICVMAGMAAQLRCSRWSVRDLFLRSWSACAPIENPNSFLTGKLAKLYIFTILYYSLCMSLHFVELFRSQSWKGSAASCNEASHVVLHNFVNGGSILQLSAAHEKECESIRR